MEENQIIVDVGLDAFIASLRQLQKQYELNAAALKAMRDAGEEQSDAYITLTQEQKVLRQQMASTEKSIQNEIKMQQAQEGSLVQLRAQLANLNKQYDSMSGMERMGKSGEELQGRIKALHDQILGLEGDTGRMQRNVGNYPEAIKPVTAQLREMTQELIRLRVEGKANTAEYNELLRKTGEMKDAMMDAQAEVKQMASDTSTLNSVLAGAQAAAGAFSVALGVMNLVGDKDSETAKELAEAQQKLQAAIAITTGLQAVQNALQKESALMMGVAKLRILAAAAAQKLYAAATHDAEAAQAAFNKVAKSNVYVWLAGIIVSVVGAIAAFTRGSKEQKEQLKGVNNELKTQLQVLQYLNEAYKGMASEAENTQQRYIEALKASGASTEKIRAEEDKLHKMRIQNLRQQRKELGYGELEVTYWEKEYTNGLRNITELEKVLQQAIKEQDEDGRIYAENEIERQRQINAALKGRIDLFRSINADIQTENTQYKQTLNEREQQDAQAAEQTRQRRQQAYNDYLTKLKTLREETIKAYKDITDNLPTLRELEENESKRMKQFADDLQYTLEKTGLFKEGIEKLRTPLEIFGEVVDVTDENLKNDIDYMELFAEAFRDNSEAIQESSTALQTSFSSLSSMYQAMARDESKTEEEREAAARKAKAWARIQIATNAATAVAKGVASAVDVGFPAAIPAIATMLAAILSAIAQAKSLAAEAHEHGGVIGNKFIGATRGKDNVTITARRGEMMLNADQQRRLYDIANGGGVTNLTAELAEALQSMPAPVLVYSEFQRFTDRVVTLDETAKLH